MSVRTLRIFLNYAVVMLATLTAKYFFDQWRIQGANKRNAEFLLELCDLPALPEEIIVKHAAVDPTPNREFVNVALTLTGEEKILDRWLEEVDQWTEKRPGKILNHQLREAENASRVDFSAEVFFK